MADIKIAYDASAALTITLASLASSSTLVTGRESAAISNASNLYLDVLLSGSIRTGTSPTAGTIEVWLYASILDTPAYPDVLDGTDSGKTMTSADIKRTALAHVASIPTDTTTDQDYPFNPVSVASRFGGVMPQEWGVFVTHDTVAALDSTGHAINYLPVYVTSA